MNISRSHERYLHAFEAGNLDAELVAERLTALKATTQQLVVRRDNLTSVINTEPSAPDPVTLAQVADHLVSIINTGTANQRKALVEALIARVTITGPNRLVPVFRVPQPDNGTRDDAQPAGAARDAPVRTMTNSVGRVGLEPTT
jgi:site-specific DNA recombinase